MNLFSIFINSLYKGYWIYVIISIWVIYKAMHGLVRLLNSLKILSSNTPAANTLTQLFPNLCITTGIICFIAKSIRKPAMWNTQNKTYATASLKRIKCACKKFRTQSSLTRRCKTRRVPTVIRERSYQKTNNLRGELFSLGLCPILQSVY